ncbi:MAG: FKBP-type peptidyl-prolyl cis-trans isomerase [bacterium]
MIIQRGSIVRLNYVGKFEDGEIFGRSSEPIEFEVGDGTVIPGIEEGVVGMSQGERKEIVVPPEKGYGERQEHLIVEYSRSMIQGDVDVGDTVQLRSQAGRSIRGLVTSVEAGTVTVDFNNPLAGKTVIFEVEIVEVR